MNLVLLYGPPAVGKFTVASELSALTGYKNFHNHLVMNTISEIFEYGHPSNRKLQHEIRGRMVEEAALAGMNLIVTGAIANHNKYLYQGMIDAYKNNGGEAHLVRLIADPAVLESRVSHPSRERKIHVPSELTRFITEHPESVERFGEGEQLEIDTSQISPTEAAQKISSYYHLL